MASIVTSFIITPNWKQFQPGVNKQILAHSYTRTLPTHKKEEDTDDECKICVGLRCIL